MRPRTYWLVVLLLGGMALAFRWPALRTGFIVDDYAQLSMMQGTYPVPRAPLELFTFSDGTLRDNDVLRATGFFPWWSQPNLRISLFRPLASALMWADRALFGGDAFAYHLHSACWWVLMVAIWAAVLRELLPATIAVIALVLCLLHPAHTVVLGWIASRNAMVSTAFALFGLWTQLRRRERSGAGALLTWSSYAVALAASEYALGFLIFALLLEWELGRGAGARWKRLLAPLGLLVAYGALRGALGFGARASGMYIDPILEPRAFVAGALSRLPVLAGDLVFGVRSNWWGGGYPQAARVVAALRWPLSWVLDVRPWRVLEVALGTLALITMSVVAWSVLRTAKRAQRPELRFAASGLLLAMLPYLGGFPEGRLLLPALFGWTVVLGQFVAARLPPQRTEARSWSTRLALGFAGGLVLLEGITSYEFSSDDTRDLPRIAGAVRASILAPQLDAALAGARRAMLVSAVDPTTTIYIPLVRRWHGRPAPEQCHLLLSAFSQLRLERNTDRSFSLERLQTEYTPPDAYATVFNREALHDGDRFSAGGLAVIVERTFEGRPMRVRYELDTLLDDPSAVLLIQTLQGLQQVRFPPPGQSILLPPPLLPFGLIPPSNHGGSHFD